ncbi:hypothetical protein BP5796_01299 [Coleophoma crateriformis]|uniref:HTH APSES-type domain-containing protein n=1 Tax=Coleophoma crateriformis TaxID=565419 RepID=A0A3D8T012_9HELO|nr:hypothetical protein BP5796_01299 [Coleophoma crateriformis]
MVSVASLLNPVPKESRDEEFRSSPAPSLISTRTSSPSNGSPVFSFSSTPIFKQKMTKDGAVFVKGKTKGDINYPPFERLDEKTIREIRKFHVKHLGSIGDYARHIPYNSEKKTFLERTGRECFEVFQYEFQVPGDDKIFTVMWDYNIGLVRITPFFKCCKYSKTTPAKMLSLNPGLREITHSITGGALAAQGYWMPYSCARAICATFCSHISGALIPLFGPDFPFHCVSPEAPEHGRMVIDPVIIRESTIQAEQYRQLYSTESGVGGSNSSPRTSYSPQQSHMLARQPGIRTTPEVQISKRLRLKRTFDGRSPYTDTDDHAGSETSGDGYFTRSTPSPSIRTPFTGGPRTYKHHQHHNQFVHNNNSHTNLQRMVSAPGPNPLLSAVPRSSGSFQTYRGGWCSINKTHEEDIDANADADYEAEAEESAPNITASAATPAKDNSMLQQPRLVETKDIKMTEDSAAADKKAAFLLMNLNIKDREIGHSPTSPSMPGHNGMDMGAVGTSRRAKRVRASSF